MRFISHLISFQCVQKHAHKIARLKQPELIIKETISFDHYHKKRKIIWNVVWIGYYLRLNLSSRRYCYIGYLRIHKIETLNTREHQNNYIFDAISLPEHWYFYFSFFVLICVFNWIWLLLIKDNCRSINI